MVYKRQVGRIAASIGDEYEASRRSADALWQGQQWLRQKLEEAGSPESSGGYASAS
jgi:hypothetical protein